jgi:hypothetical protein
MTRDARESPPREQTVHHPRSPGMEHRYHRRIQVRAPVILRTALEDELAHCEVLDVCREGLRLSIVQGPRVGLAINTVVEITLPKQGEPAASWPSAPAMVVYSAGTQLGMWFHHEIEDAAPLVRALMELSGARRS